MWDRARLRTLVLLVDPTPPRLRGAGPGRILLGRKKRGFGAGKWNGFGGKLEAGESLEEAAGRELREEAGLTAVALQRRGVLSFTFANGLPPLVVQVFLGQAWEGEARETEEMLPQWWPIEAIPYDKMWVDDQHWLPLFLAGRSFMGHFHLLDTETLLSFKVKAVAPQVLARQA